MPDFTLPAGELTAEAKSAFIKKVTYAFDNDEIDYGTAVGKLGLVMSEQEAMDHLSL